MEQVFDILIIGGGPAGLTAGIYAKRAGKNVAIIEKFTPGGQVAITNDIENYLGFDKINGFELANKFYQHAVKIGVQFIFEEALDYNFSKDIKKVVTKKHTYKAKAIIIATGCKTRELNILGEQEFKGKGVSYCATCDGNFFKDKTVAVVGSGDSAVGDAIYLAGICKRVYLLTKSYLKVKNYNIEDLNKYKNIKVLSGALSGRIEGKQVVEKLIYVQDEKEKTLKVDGVFIAIGRLPDNVGLAGKIELSENGYIKVDNNMMTSCQGVFACGDIVDGSIRQIVNATGDGAKASIKAQAYVNINFKKSKIAK